MGDIYFVPRFGLEGHSSQSSVDRCYSSVGPTVEAFGFERGTRLRVRHSWSQALTRRASMLCLVLVT